MLRAYYTLEESAQRVGYNNGQREGIAWDALGREVVGFHENVHTRIFHETLDGKLHIYLLRLADMQPGSAEGRAARRAVNFLFNDTRIPHERSATYLGIKQLADPAARVTEIAALDSEYRQYYAFFSDLFDHIVESTFLQYSLAWAAACWAFSTERARLIGDDSWRELRVLRAMEGPGERLALVKSELGPDGGKSGLGMVIERAAAQLRADGLEWENIDSEEEWVRESPSLKAQRAELAIFDSMQSWLNEKLDRRCLLLRDICDEALVDKLAQVGIRVADRFRTIDVSSFDKQPDDVRHEVASDLASIADGVAIMRSGLRKPNRLDADRWARFINGSIGTSLFFSVVVDPNDRKRPFVFHASYEAEGEIRKVAGAPFCATKAEMAMTVAALGARMQTPPVPLVYPADEGDIVTGAFRVGGAVRVRCAKSLRLESEYPGVTMLPLIYVPRLWAEVLERVGGTLSQVRVTLSGGDPAGRESWQVNVLFPPERGWYPYVKFRPWREQGGGNLELLIRYLEKKGTLKRKRWGTKSNKALDLLWIAIWDTYGEL